MSNAVWANNTDFFNVVNGIQQWTVPTDGTYRITAYGAQGGNGGRTGGAGAIMRGDFELIQGEVIQILVGHQGETGGHSQNTGQSIGAGGGGTFVVRAPYNTNESILVIAGGGGGGANNSWTVADGRPALTTTNGNSGQRSNEAGGTNGSAGVQTGHCTAGAGFFGDSPPGSGSPAGSGAKSFVNGGEGARNARSWGGPENYGGFGGGGGGGGLAAGGGGGYSGGGSGDWSSQQAGGGGGSWNSGANQENSVGWLSGHGKVEIELL